MALPGETCQLSTKAYIFQYNPAKRKWDAVGDRQMCKLQLLRRRSENRTTYRLIARTENYIAEPILCLEIASGKTKLTSIDELFIQLSDDPEVYGFKFDEQSDTESFRYNIEETLLPQVPVEDELPPPRLPPKAAVTRRAMPDTFSSVQPRAASPQMPRLKQRPEFQSVAPVSKAPIPTRLTDETVVDSLRDAIAEGAVDQAKTLASKLAERKANIKIEVLQGKPEISANKCRLKVMIEDRESSGGSFYINITLSSAVKTLKKIAYDQYGFPHQVQRWFYKQRLFRDDNERLNELGVQPDSVINLYLLSAKSVPAKQEREEIRQRQQNRVLATHSHFNENPRVMQDGIHTTPAAPLSSVNPHPLQSRPLHPFTVQNHPLADQLGNEVLQRKLLINDDVNFARPPSPEPEQPPVGWHCPDCTFINQPTRPGCEVCGSNRPADYKIPANYVLTDEEKKRLDEEKRQQDLLLQAQEEEKRIKIEERKQNRDRMLHTADLDLIPNEEPFECPICYCDVEPGDGVRLRECLHLFCKECLAEHVRNSQDPDVRCPFIDDDYQCNEPLTEREIRRLVSAEELARLHSRGVDLALGEMGNSFYCRTPDCQGRCVYDDDVNDFDCPICRKRNCLLCKAIHYPEMNCKEYQDDLKRKAANDAAARATQEMLEQMVKNGDAMYCPKCKVIVQKKDGCDWIRCSMCKTEICWATKGPRWGPKGKGDISGGCRCGVGKKRCHPKCRNCH